MFRKQTRNGNAFKTELRPLKQPYYRSLTLNLVLIIVIVTFTPGILVMGTILRQFSTSYHEKVYSHLQELVQKHKQNINMFLSEKLADIQLIVETHELHEFSDEPKLEQLLKTLQHLPAQAPELGQRLPAVGGRLLDVGPHILCQALQGSGSYCEWTGCPARVSLRV